MVLGTSLLESFTDFLFDLIDVTIANVDSRISHLILFNSYNFETKYLLYYIELFICYDFNIDVN